jgi:hypothetical protein
MFLIAHLVQISCAMAPLGSTIYNGWLSEAYYKSVSFWWWIYLCLLTFPVLWSWKEEVHLHYNTLQGRFHFGLTTTTWRQCLNLVETLGRAVYIVIFPDKCIPGTFASECRTMFLTWLVHLFLNSCNYVRI